MKISYSKLLKVTRLLLLFILTVAIAYIALTKDLSKLIQWQVLVIAIVAAFPALILNAAILKFLVSTIDKNIPIVEALNLATLSVLGNSLGVPVGSGVKYYILHSKHDVNPLLIILGNFLITIVTGVIFLAFSLIVKLHFLKSHSYIFLVVLLAVISFGAIFLIVRKLLPKILFEASYFTVESFSKIIFFSFISFLIYIWWYGIIIYYCFGELDHGLVSGVSLSVGFGLVSGLASIAGYHEVVIAYISDFLGIQWYRGAELALIYRITALISSLLVFILFIKKYVGVIWGQRKSRG